MKNDVHRQLKWPWAFTKMWSLPKIVSFVYNKVLVQSRFQIEKRGPLAAFTY